ncbi:antigen peptide transporter 2-like [Acipenser ruthenus]|uniref:antigen peptide transporter 2-like n=1 Tax=Acipenser ruthenus TaxID=7906 RepID=UPI002740428D|nr:antigen peptide transporter 2-like [Acipenser ruthenus]XP_058864934.1 antigen peptide transporter 2-like [Acipenser ruthenus]XP_058864935.1 antigen peptide transporter 2-like [Acipenser ruthenus]
MNVIAVVISFLACDIAASSLLHCGLLLLPLTLDPFGAESLLCLWLVALVKLALLSQTSLSLLSQAGRGSAVRGRAPLLYAAALCALTPALQSWQRVVYVKPVEIVTGSPCLGFCLLASAVTATACLFWETALPCSAGTEAGDSSGEEKKQQARVLFMRVIGYSKPDIVLLGGAFLFLSLAVIFEMFIPFYTGKVIDILGSRYKQNAFSSAILFMGLFSLGSSLSAGLRGGLFMCSLSRLNKRVRVLLFRTLVKQEIGFFETTKTGDITSRLSTDTTLMSQSVAMNMNVFLRSLMKTLAVLSLMVSLSWRLTLVTVIETLLISILQNIYNSYYQRLAKEVQDSIARSNEAAGEAVSAIKTVRSFATEDTEAKRYDSKLSDTQRLKNSRDTIRAAHLLLRRLITLAVQVVMLYYGRCLIKAGEMSTGSLVAFILYQRELGSHIRALVYICSNMLNSVGAAAKVFEYLDRRPLVSTDGSLQPETLRGHVQFKNVSFTYPSRPDVPVIKSVSFELRPGEITALVGPSGGGKSTCVCLLERFYQPQSGEILLDGAPLQDYQHSYLHRKIALVGQEPVLFVGSIKDNIGYGLPECSLERAQEAARRANAHGFVTSLERGYNTDAGERGGQLAGGQKQRIAIARALVRNPQLLILDEATSCLDIESEHAIQESLSRTRGQTVLVIAHRLKTVEKADHIIVIEGGEVREQGTHHELMRREGNYHRLVQGLFTETQPPQ